MDGRQACLDSLAASLARLAVAQRRAAEPALAARLRALQDWQARRLAGEYADQRVLPRRRDAVEFFLDDVYGPQEFVERDAQFARAIHKLRAMLPLPGLEALRDAVELQALSVEIDVAVAQRLDPGIRQVDAAAYASAARAAGLDAGRARQLALALAIGRRLQQLTAHPGIELMLRLAATPARLAGYGALQTFIERGHAAFRRLGSEASGFLALVAEREHAFQARTGAGAGAAAEAGAGAAGAATARIAGTA